MTEPLCLPGDIVFFILPQGGHVSTKAIARRYTRSVPASIHPTTKTYGIITVSR
jgi:hypothetical protein